MSFLTVLGYSLLLFVACLVFGLWVWDRYFAEHGMSNTGWYLYISVILSSIIIVIISLR